jgi:hypothetical protein
VTLYLLYESVVALPAMYDGDEVLNDGEPRISFSFVSRVSSRKKARGTGT